ncbi:lipopolysaccharide biosynthesis protein [Sunxiuqinia indica]|uniref:lipopolysaccharide biosynthesis protein n=1 Tax=Sunxiuqinia indica TaxID=2692584 RepID=UPI0019150877|nr:lipopolysaccharide biosynthesis protein [Sunxiuqinia indica]
MLYIRMMLIMAVSLYTSRIILRILGVEDFGIYNVVGGMVSMFVFLNGALSAASSRFLAYELGKNKDSRLNEIYKTLITINLLIAVLVLVLLETIGLWFLNNKMVIPTDRLVAANWVFQFSVFSSLLMLLQIPLTSSIIAHEKMSIYAYLGIYDVCMKLIIVFTLDYINSDKLVIYGALLSLNSILVFLAYNIYCKVNFNEYSWKFLFHPRLFREILSYSGWSFIGSFSNIMKLQGVNLLLNIFFGPAVNAARGVAFQVNIAVNSFTQNFTIAMNPQIIKNYASGKYEEMLSLIMKGSKLSYFLLLFLGMPLILETEFILNLWLVDVPQYTIIFTRLVIINSLIESFTFVLGSAIQSTGKIKWYQISVGGFLILNLPISFWVLKMGYPPQSTLFVSISLAVIALIIRLAIIKKELSFFPVKEFILKVFVNATIVLITSMAAPIYFVLSIESGWERFILVSTIGIITCLGSIYFIGLNKSDQNYILTYIRNKIQSN